MKYGIQNTIYRSKAFVLVEALVASGICAAVIAGALAAFLLATEAGSSNGKAVEANYLADEGIEAVRLLRDGSYSTNIAPLTSGTTYYLGFSSNAWHATTTNAYVDGTFERSFVLGDVYRDASANITLSGGTLDSNTKKVTVTVSWSSGNGTSSRSLSAYLSNLFSN